MNENKLTLIGRGSNSQIYAYGQAQNRVVLKVISSLSKKQQLHLKNEYMMLKGLEHENIIKALKYQQKVAFQGNKMDKQLTTKNILVIEYANKGSLLAYIQKHSLGINDKRMIFMQVIEGVKYLHTQEIVHRDLKLQNILVSLEKEGSIVKISDFGFSAQITPTTVFNQHKGTPKGYMAPQIHACKLKQTSYNPLKCDIFALGVILFAIVLGKLPFQYAKQDNALYKLIIEKKYEQFWKIHHQINGISLEEGFRLEQFQYLFIKMVSFDPNQRPTIEQVSLSGWLV